MCHCTRCCFLTVVGTWSWSTKVAGGAGDQEHRKTHKTKENCLSREATLWACRGAVGRGLPVGAGPAVPSRLSCPSSWQRASGDLQGSRLAQGQPGFANRFLGCLCWWSSPGLTPLRWRVQIIRLPTCNPSFFNLSCADPFLLDPSNQSPLAHH